MMVRPYDGDYMDYTGPCCDNYPHPTMAPGQEPYTCAELEAAQVLIQDAIIEDPGEEGEQYV